MTERMPALEVLLSQTQSRTLAHAFTPAEQYASKLEARFADFLELAKKSGTLAWWKYQPLTFRLGPDVRYTPDFGALMLPAREIWMYECKGFWRDDAKAKYRIAAEMYPFFRWWTVTAEKSAHYGFDIAEMTP